MRGDSPLIIDVKLAWNAVVSIPVGWLFSMKLEISVASDESDDAKYALQSDLMLVKYTSGSIPALLSTGFAVAGIRWAQPIGNLLVMCGLVLVGPITGRCAAVGLLGRRVSVIQLAMSLKKSVLESKPTFGLHGSGFQVAIVMGGPDDLVDGKRRSWGSESGQADHESNEAGREHCVGLR
jgi:hypothetical protein